MPELPPQFKPPFTHVEGLIFAGTPKGSRTSALNVRGLGYLMGSGSEALGLGEDEADLIMDQFGDWVASTLNKATQQES